MSTRPDLTKILTECEDPPGWTDAPDGLGAGDLVYECSCGDVSPVLAHVWISVKDTEAAAEWHRAHLAAALNAAIEAWLADEGTRERMWEAVAAVRDASPRTTDDADSWDVLDAALAALTAPTTTEPEEGKR